MQFDDADLDNWFVHHPPEPGDMEAYQAIRDAGRAFAKAIVEHTPSGGDQWRAIQKTREAVFWANAARACSVERRVRNGR